MTLVANYILTSNTGQLSSGGQTEAAFHFGSLPDNALGNDSLLGFMVVAGPSPDLRVEAILNDGPVIWGFNNLAANTTTQFFAQIGFNGLKSGPTDNKITFKIVAGTGNFIVNNCVIWYHQNI